MIVFPNAKINIGLNIIQRRPDGYHDIQTCMVPIGLSDILEMAPSNTLSFQSTGIPIPGEGKNLVLQAYDLLKTDFNIEPVAIHLHKTIPMGAGLGGGSSDAAFALKLLNQLFELELSNSILENYASKLGSDCAFFVNNKPVIAKGRGDEFESIDISSVKDKFLVLICPNIHSNTKEAYSGITPMSPDKNLKNLLNGTLEYWKESVANQFENTIFKRYPELKDIKQSFYDQGAAYAAMSGSGSSVYGFFDRKTDISFWKKNYPYVHVEKIS